MEQKKDIVTLEHPDYTATAPMREVFEDVCDGTSALRAKHKTYLPQFPLEHDEDYKARWMSSTLLNVTQKTVETMCGLVFQKDITLGDDVPQKIIDIAENIDNQGNHLNIFCRNVFEESFDGWAAILVDSPATVASDLADQKTKGLRPYWRMYEACDVINWDYQVNPVNHKNELSLVVFRECSTVPAGRYLRNEVTRYRTFFLENGSVYYRVDEEQTDDKTKEKKIVEIVPDTRLDAVKAIPVAFVGEPGDEPVLMDLAYTNLKFAQKESDLDNIVHMTCVPLKYSVGISAEEFGKVAISGATMFHLGTNPGAAINIVEVTGASIDKARQRLEDFKADMAMLGLAMLASNRRANANVTATEKLLDTIKETSTLQVRAIQLKDAIEAALGFTAQYFNLGDVGGGSITLGATWSEMMLSPQEIQVLATLVADGALSLESFLFRLEKGDFLPEDVTAADELKRIEAEAKAATPLRLAAKMPNGQQGGVNGDQTQPQPPNPQA